MRAPSDVASSRTRGRYATPSSASSMRGTRTANPSIGQIGARDSGQGETERFQWARTLGLRRRQRAWPEESAVGVDRLLDGGERLLPAPEIGQADREVVEGHVDGEVVEGNGEIG